MTTAKVKFRLLILGVLLVGIIGACGVAIVRPVTINTHKRPTFNMAKVNRLAVLEASSQSASSTSAADIMSLRLLDHGFNVIERARIKSLLNEFNLKLSYDEDVKGAVKIGDLLEAQSLLLISISDTTSGQQMIPGGCMSQARIESVMSMGITARLVDVNTSEVIWVGAASTQDRGLQECLTRMSDELIKSISEK